MNDNDQSNINSQKNNQEQLSNNSVKPVIQPVEIVNIPTNQKNFVDNQIKSNKKIILAIIISVFIIGIGSYFLLKSSSNSKSIVNSSSNSRNSPQFTYYPNINSNNVIGFDHLGNLWANDGENKIFKYKSGFNSSTTPTTFIDQPSWTKDGNNPTVLSNFNFDKNNNLSYLSTSPDATYSEDMIPSNAKSSQQPSVFNIPDSLASKFDLSGSPVLAFDNSGNLWITNYNTRQIAMIPSNGFPNVNPILYSLPGNVDTNEEDSNFTPTVVFDSYGNTWINSLKLSEIPANSPANVTPIVFPDTLGGYQSMAADKNGNVWLSDGTNITEIPAGNKPNGINKTFEVTGPISGNANTIFADSMNNIWVTDGDTQLSEIPAGSPTGTNPVNYTIPNRTTEPAKAIYQPIIYNCAPGQTTECDGNGRENIPFGSPTPLNEIITDKKGNLWVPEWDQITELKYSSSKYSTINYTLPSKVRASEIFLDNSGSIWLNNNLHQNYTESPLPTKPTLFTKFIAPNN
ncbi:MAG: hypothetical protein WCI37_02880 [bacterium]